MMLTAVLFGLAHVPNDDATVLSACGAALGGLMYGLVTQHTTGSEVLAGGAYGPEGGRVVIALVVAVTSRLMRRSAEVGTPGPGRTV
jgi:hypothetical protein